MSIKYKDISEELREQILRDRHQHSYKQLKDKYSVNLANLRLICGSIKLERTQTRNRPLKTKKPLDKQLIRLLLDKGFTQGEIALLYRISLSLFKAQYADLCKQE